MCIRDSDCTINFKLREGVKFHNGDELKASDVIFTLNRLVKDNTVAAKMCIRDSVCAVQRSSFAMRSRRI